jgi:hypothetical protein
MPALCINIRKLLKMIEITKVAWYLLQIIYLQLI